MAEGNQTQAREKEQKLVLGLNGELAPILSIPRLSREQLLGLSFGKRIFYTLMRIRETIRASQPESYQLLNGVYTP